MRIDREKMAQVVINLLDNALTFTPSGGSVVVEVGPGDGGARLTVADTGSGIPEEDLPLIFERFYRVDESRSRALGGSGIGLTIVREIVRAHGGSVEVSSRQGEGSVFTVRLPGNGSPPGRGPQASSPR